MGRMGRNNHHPLPKVVSFKTAPFFQALTVLGLEKDGASFISNAVSSAEPLISKKDDAMRHLFLRYSSVVGAWTRPEPAHCV
jgi:hypothetical protein